MLSEWALRAIEERRSIQRTGVFAGSPKVLDALIRMLSHSSGGVRIDAARALEHFAEILRVRDALLLLLTDQVWDVR